MCYNNRFVDLKSDILEADGMITAQVEVPAEAIWFDGHFPDQAILPGVAQLAMVVEILGHALKKNVYAANVSRVRFKQVIMPAERIEVQISPKDDEGVAYGFRLLKREVLACSGFLKLGDT
jgi:3-hydroxymyristoyl/3-hydroxydecanoyl-(acyl carrier protein) dehydratase